jgi:hypothetical protein
MKGGNLESAIRNLRWQWRRPLDELSSPIEPMDETPLRKIVHIDYERVLRFRRTT